MLRLKNVAVSQGVFRLRADVDITAPVTAILGPSGAGKSTLLNVIAGFSKPKSGEILWDGRDMSGQPPNERPVAMIFQDNNVFPHLSVAENLALAVQGRDKGEERSDAIAHALDRVGLNGFERRMPATLSGGQLARVALARVLLQKRPLVLLDEAFASLGPALTREMLQLVHHICKEDNLQALMISHNPEDARLIADEGLVVLDGNVSAPMQIDELLRAPPSGLADYL